MTVPNEDPAFVRDIAFLEIIHDMKHTAALTIERLIMAVAHARAAKTDVTMDPEATVAIIKLITFQDLLVGKLSEENLEHKDIAEELLRKIESLPEPGMLTERPTAE